MIPKKGKPYFWVTWITGLLSGEDKCEYKIWVKGKFEIPKVPETPEKKEFWKTWTAKHDAMVHARRATLIQEGYKVLMEQEAKFMLEGDVAKLGGQPDLVAVKGIDPVLVMDQKSGKVKERYVWQVLLYMFAMPLTLFKGKIIRGEIEYPDNNIVSVPPRQLSQDNKMRIGKLMMRLASDTEPPKVPSLYECQYCELLECSERFKAVETGDAKGYF